MSAQSQEGNCYAFHRPVMSLYVQMLMIILTIQLRRNADNLKIFSRRNTIIFY